MLCYWAGLYTDMNHLLHHHQNHISYIYIHTRIMILLLLLVFFKMKYVWYNLHLALKRESTILRGLVFILNMMNNQQLSLKSFDRLKNKMIVKATVNCFPVHIRAVHYCTRPQALHLRMILPVLKFFMNQELRQRLVVHAQHTNELREELVGYNIRLEVLPTCLGGRFQLNPYWAEEQRELEQR
mmetsp:Transcript_18434/g.24187  ORF Transcript_18434/g.24187 Transcript_18434/m.24187 type:complete len:184 (-) Transcript_18434:93-644(-)